MKHLEEKQQKIFKTGNSLYSCGGCVVMWLQEHFKIGNTNFYVVVYGGYFRNWDLDDIECEFEDTSLMYACFFGNKKKAKPFPTIEKAVAWAINQVKTIKYIEDEVILQTPNSDSQRSEQLGALD